MSDWSYPQLRVALCRYTGSVYDDSLIIMAHNYDWHFGGISAATWGKAMSGLENMMWK